MHKREGFVGGPAKTAIKFESAVGEVVCAVCGVPIGFSQ